MYFNDWKREQGLFVWTWLAGGVGMGFAWRFWGGELLVLQGVHIILTILFCTNIALLFLSFAKAIRT